MATIEPEGLAGTRILIVEDEFYLADDLARALREQGAEVVGPIGSLGKAQEVLDGAPVDCAILDMNLKGEMAFPIGERLQAEGVPFVVASGYSSGAIPDQFKNVPHIEKPFDAVAVVESVRDLLHESRVR